MPTKFPQLGSVVWVEVADPNGYRKIRPAIIVSPTSDIAPGNPVRLIAVTTRLTDPIPKEYVLLPWDPSGKSQSGLRRKCAAVANWQIGVPLEDIQSVIGLLPPSTINELLVAIAECLGQDLQGGTEPGI